MLSMSERFLSATHVVAAAMLVLFALVPLGQPAVAAPDTDPAGGYINLGYVYSSNLDAINRMDFSPLTHINYAFGLIYNEEYLDPLAPRYGQPDNWPNVAELEADPALLHTIRIGEWGAKTADQPLPGETALRRIIEKRNEEAPHVKVLLSVGGYYARGFSEMASTPESRAIFIRSAQRIVSDYKLDGIDLDWEFPSMDAWGWIKFTEHDRENFTLLLKELREALGDDLLLTIAGSGNVLFPQDWANMAEASQYLDFVNIMTYDFHYGGTFFDWPLGSSRHWPSLSLADDYTANWAVLNYVSAGVPREKITIGYKPGSSRLPGDVRSLYNAADEAKRLSGPYANAAKSLEYAAWVNSALNASGWTRAPFNEYPIYRRVEEALDGNVFTGTSGDVAKDIEFHREYDRYAGLATVIAYNLTDDPDRKHKLFVMSYNDPESINARAEYIQGNSLAGSFFWSYSGDVNTLWVTRTVSEALKQQHAIKPADYMNLAYIYTSSVGSINNMDFAPLTHINYAFGLIYNEEYLDPQAPQFGNPDGWPNVVELEADPALLHTIRVGEWGRKVPGEPLPGEIALKRIIEKRNEEAPHVKVLLSVGGYYARGFSEMASAKESRATFIQSALSLVDEFGLDGIDLDWEFPSMDAWGWIKFTENDRENFTLLMKELREALGNDLLLTIAGSANILFPQVWTDMASVMEHLDFINLMTYDFHHETNYFGYALGSSRDWLTVDIGADYNVDFAVFNYVSGGVPRHKINVGYTTGAIQLPGALRGPAGDETTKWNWINNALSASGWSRAPYNTYPTHQRVEEVLDGKTYTGAYRDVSKEIEFHRGWDRLAGLATVHAYDLTDDPERTTKLFVMSYLDEQALAARTDYIVGAGLSGSFFWQYGGDVQSWLAKTVSGNLGLYTPVEGD